MGAARERGSGGDRSAAAVGARPLRWWKFGAYLLPAAMVCARGWPALSALLETIARGTGPVGRPVVAGAALALLGLLSVALLVRDAGWDRPAPTPLLVFLVLAAVAPGGAP